MHCLTNAKSSLWLPWNPRLYPGAAFYAFWALGEEKARYVGCPSVISVTRIFIRHVISFHLISLRICVRISKIGPGSNFGIGARKLTRSLKKINCKCLFRLLLLQSFSTRPTKRTLWMVFFFKRILWIFSDPSSGLAGQPYVIRDKKDGPSSSQVIIEPDLAPWAPGPLIMSENSFEKISFE